MIYKILVDPEILQTLEKNYRDERVPSARFELISDSEPESDCDPCGNPDYYGQRLIDGFLLLQGVCND